MKFGLINKQISLNSQIHTVKQSNREKIEKARTVWKKSSLTLKVLMEEKPKIYDLRS